MKHLFLSFLILVMFSCKSQEKKEVSTQIKDTMDYFDISKYNKLPIDSKNNYKVLPNGNHFTIDIDKNQTILKIIKQNTPYKDYFEYYDNKIKVKSFLFYSIQHG